MVNGQWSVDFPKEQVRPCCGFTLYFSFPFMEIPRNDISIMKFTESVVDISDISLTDSDFDIGVYRVAQKECNTYDQ